MEIVNILEIIQMMIMTTKEYLMVKGDKENLIRIHYIKATFQTVKISLPNSVIIQ
jgi:hypothetical protein